MPTQVYPCIVGLCLFHEELCLSFRTFCTPLSLLSMPSWYKVTALTGCAEHAEEMAAKRDEVTALYWSSSTHRGCCCIRHFQECRGGCGVAAVPAETEDGRGPRQMGLAHPLGEEPALLVRPQLASQPRLCILSTSFTSPC